MTKKRHHEQPHLKLSKHMESKIEKQARLQRLNTAVALYVALGGGWVGPEKVAEVKTTIEQTVAKLISEGPSEDELKRGKSMAVSAQQLSIQSNLDRAQTMVLDELYKLGFDNYLNYSHNIEAVTAEQVRQVAAQMLDLNRATVVVTTPE